MEKIKKISRKIDWPNQLLNFIGTLLGVLIAFWLSTYQANQKEQERLEVANKNILAEVERNYERTQSHIDTLDYAIRALRAIEGFVNDSMEIVTTLKQMENFQTEFAHFYKAENPEAINDTLYNFHGNMNLNFNLLDISDIAWKNANGLGIIHQMETEKAFVLFQVYTFQEQVQQNAQKAVETLKAALQEEENPIIRKIIFNDYLSQLRLSIQFEKGLLLYYDRALDVLE